jgi:hypothetical protein
MTVLSRRIATLHRHMTGNIRYRNFRSRANGRPATRASECR